MTKFLVCNLIPILKWKNYCREGIDWIPRFLVSGHFLTASLPSILTALLPFFFSHLFHSFWHVSSPSLSLFLNLPLLSPWLCVESTTVEFVLLPLIRLVLIFLPPSYSSAEWMNFFNCLSQAHLHCSAQWPRGLLPAIYYEIKIDGCWNVILWLALLRPMMISCLTGYGMSVPLVCCFSSREQSYKVLGKRL